MPTGTTLPATVEHFVSGGRPITIDLFLPKSGGRHPACLILHGTFGLLPQYRADIVSFGEALAENGVVAAMPHYFERTGTAPGTNAGFSIPQHLAAWKATCGDALAFTRGH